MGINPTLPNFKSFTFNGVNSRTYGVYITGEGAFNAPERNVEMIDIAGRNGAFALDRGNFMNIEVTYPASIATDNETDFAEAVSDLRNFLCSKVGYVRLEDDYNPNEYRLAIYKSGLEVSHDMLIAGEFDIVFECKPQRYLKSGETAISVTSGSSISNPTLFPSHPQLQVWGKGTVTVGGKPVTISNGALGRVFIAPSSMESGSADFGTSTIFYTYINKNALNTGDTIQIDGEQFEVFIQYPFNTVTSVSVSSTTNCSAICHQGGTNTWSVSVSLDPISFTLGTSATASASCSVVVTVGGNSRTYTFGRTVEYNGNMQLKQTFSQTGNTTESPSGSYQINIPTITGNSTKNALGSPSYIDLETGEAWNGDYSEPISLNSIVSLPAELPTLKSGNTSITYDVSITQLKIVPRWWKV